ncbi:MAG: GPW/gp25 family protein, partial [Anaerolineae bacterium]
FGSRLQELVFAPLSPETMGLAELYVQEALTFWEPRIQLLDVIAEVAPEHPAMLLITINYIIKATHDRRSLVYPFYQIPGE